MLNTEQESDVCRQQAYQAHMNEHADSNYKSVTTGWSETTQRATDGKFIVPYCEHLGTMSYVVEESVPAWFEIDRPYGL